MATFEPISQNFMSPKRKRGSDSSSYSPPLSKALPRLSTELSQHAGVEPSDTGSPRSLVANHLQQLSFKDVERARKRFAYMSPEPEQTKSAETQHMNRGTVSPVAPIDLLENSPLTSSPLADSASTETTETSPNQVIFSRPHARSRSPPPCTSKDDNLMTWHESEITGHDPQDPEDDGYGINGIGFRPTAATAWSRSQRRKQQIAEYRTREAREARQRRSERRRNGSRDMLETLEVEPKKRPRVRFEDITMETI